MDISGFDNGTILIFLFVFVILYYILSLPENPPPGPRGWPIIGNMLEFSGSRGKLPEMFAQHAEKYGNIFQLKFGSIPVIVVNGYDLISDVLIKKSNVFSDRPDFLYFTLQIGTGVVLSSGQKWKDMRRMSLNAMRDFGMGKSTTEEKIQDEVNAIIGILSENENKPAVVHKYLAMASSNIICNIIFGSRFEYSDSKFQKMIRLLNDVFSRPGLFQICNAFPLLRFVPRFKKGLIDNIDAFDRFGQFVKEVVQDHEVSYDKDNMRDFIDMFIKFRNEDNNASYTLRNFLRLIIDLFMAGTETTSSTLNWSVLYMMAYPDIQIKCQEEIERVIGHGRLVKYADRTKLPYIEATIYEVQRLSNIAPLSVPHATLQKTRLNGFSIPEHSIVIPNLYSVHMDPTLWPEPEKFKPERFLKDDGKAFRPDSFMPFSIGPRQCAGEVLAKMELFLYFTNLLQCFTFKKPEGASLNLEGFTGLTRSPRPYEVIAVKR